MTRIGCPEGIFVYAATLCVRVSEAGIKGTAACIKPHGVCEGVRQWPPVSQVKTKITAKATMGIGLSGVYNQPISSPI